MTDKAAKERSEIGDMGQPERELHLSAQVAEAGKSQESRSEKDPCLSLGKTWQGLPKDASAIESNTAVKREMAAELFAMGFSLSQIRRILHIRRNETAIQKENRKNKKRSSKR